MLYLIALGFFAQAFNEIENNVYQTNEENSKDFLIFWIKI